MFRPNKSFNLPTNRFSMRLFNATISLFFICFSLMVSAQEERMEIKGVVKANTGDLQGVTVYNLSSNKGGITNEKGEFSIRVKENDILEVASLVFTNFKVIVTKDELKSRLITIYLIEFVNNLDEVVLIKDGLTGLLSYDASKVKVFNTNIDFSLGSIDMSKYDFSADYKSAAQNIITRQGELYNMADPGKIIKLISGLFKSKKKKYKSIEDDLVYLSTLSLEDKYTPNFYVENFNIPADKVQAFLVFIDTSYFSKILLLPKKEMELLEYLNTKSIAFLAKK